MATGTTARDYGKQLVHYMRKGFTFADDGSTLSVGILPAGAMILKPLSGVQVNQAFNAGTTNVLDVGTAADTDFWATDLALGSVAFVPLDEAVSMVVAEDTEVKAVVDLTGTAATTGQGEVVIAYILDNDG
jgi:hypothetical protein